MPIPAEKRGTPLDESPMNFSLFARKTIKRHAGYINPPASYRLSLVRGAQLLDLDGRSLHARAQPVPGKTDAPDFEVNTHACATPPRSHQNLANQGKFVRREEELQFNLIAPHTEVRLKVNDACQ
jgi:hypothetical protein